MRSQINNVYYNNFTLESTCKRILQYLNYDKNK